MTAPTPEKIQRYNPQRKHVDFEPVTNGHWVTHSDHLRHLKLAQIAALEELIAHMRACYTSETNPTGSYCNEESLWIADKIEEIRRKIE